MKPQQNLDKFALHMLSTCAWKCLERMKQEKRIKEDDKQRRENVARSKADMINKS